MMGRTQARVRTISEERRRPAPSLVPSFAVIYRQYFDFVWSSARRLGVTPEAVDDVVQEIFIVVHRRLYTLQKPESLRSWIYGIVRRVVSAHRRARRSRETSGGSFPPPGRALEQAPPTPFDLTLKANERKRLFELIAELDSIKREVFMLVELEGMTVPEVAESLEIPLNTAYSRLRSARQAFEETLARDEARSRGSKAAGARAGARRRPSR